MVLKLPLGLSTDETTMIGDTMETDILGGVQLGFHTVLVFSGGTQAEDLPRYAYQPETIVPSLQELADLLERTNWVPPWCKVATPDSLPLRPVGQGATRQPKRSYVSANLPLRPKSSEVSTVSRS